MIYHISTKVGLVLTLYIVLFLGALAASSVFQNDLNQIASTATVLGILILYGFTRIFRSEKESNKRRPFWLVTTSPLAGFIVLLIFGGTGFRLAVLPGSGFLEYLAATLSVLFASFGLYSAIKFIRA